MSRSPWSIPVAICALAFVGGAVFAAARPDLGWQPSVVPHAAALQAHSPSPSAQSAPKVDSAPTAEPANTDRTADLQLIEASRDVTGDRFPAGVKIVGAMPHRMILFTFDDGPSRQTTPQILDVLDRLDIRALFFVSTQSFGKGNPWEREHAEIVREIVRRGHLVGNHTETHRQLPLLRNVEIGAELDLSEQKISETIGRRPHLFRPPGGALSTRVEQILATRGYTTVLWTLYGGDAEVETAQRVVDTFFRVLARRERETGDQGGILLLHDTKPHTLQALPQLVEGLRRRNCELLAAGEELYDIVDDLSYFLPDSPADPATIAKRQEALRARTQRSRAAVASN